MTIWWAVYAIGGISLALFAGRGPNAVWGTATLGLIIGLIVALFQAGFDWSTIAKGLTAGAGIGLVFELLPRLLGKGRR